jgi:N-acyl homoserine lactone hydrolase
MIPFSGISLHQIRAPVYEVTPLLTATIKDMPKSGLIARNPPAERLDCPLIAFLIRNGRSAIVMDTGPGLPEEGTDGRPFVYGSRSLKQLLADAGAPAEAIELVVLSHLHWDHCGAMAAFPNATFLVRDRELSAAIAPVAIYEEVYGLDGRAPKWLPFRTRIQPLRGEVEIAEGITVVDLPGHAPGLIGLRLRTQQGDTLLSSDACPLYENLERNVPPGSYWNVEDCYRSLRSIEAMNPDRLFPGHEIKVFDNRD